MDKKKSRVKKQDLIKILGGTVLPEKHPEIAGVTVIGDRNSFPISWLQKFDYCEYQVYLEHFKKVKAKPTMAMIIGSKEHHRLEAEFKVDAEPATFEEMLELSEHSEIYSRELPVMSLEYGIHGLIDEIKMGPNGYTIIDDKPGTKMYWSNAFQVFGYCIAFKEMIGKPKDKEIYAGLRERGTNNIYWKVLFDEKLEEMIIALITRVHNLILGKEEFTYSKNINKCLKCRFYRMCDKKVLT